MLIVQAAAAIGLTWAIARRCSFFRLIRQTRVLVETTKQFLKDNKGNGNKINEGDRDYASQELDKIISAIDEIYPSGRRIWIPVKIWDRLYETEVRAQNVRLFLLLP
ncbi:hypothetical protein JW899_02105 [Candidatus Uhrbacteria bacterium]|nr:hypothetical protein [Candidatus Uhrbacteria bacterium]